ncbi:hypothetical protein HN51_015359, partial [Arachis hypogaea]
LLLRRICPHFHTQFLCFDHTLFSFHQIHHHHHHHHLQHLLHPNSNPPLPLT